MKWFVVLCEGVGVWQLKVFVDVFVLVVEGIYVVSQIYWYGEMLIGIVFVFVMQLIEVVCV